LKNSDRSVKDAEVVRITIDGKKVLLALAIVVVILGGVAIRAHTLADSQYPYILDGLLEARYAEHIAGTGYLTPEHGASYEGSHTTSTPAYDVFVAQSALFTGEDPLFLIGGMAAPLSMLTLLGVYVLARRLTDNLRVATVALMGTAAYGPFVIVTQASWKECFGMSLLPFLMISFLMRKDPRMRVISTLLLLMMPFVHHLIALIAILTIAIFSFARLLLAKRAGGVGSTEIMDVFVSVVSLNFMALYYGYMQFDRLEYLTPDNGLYLFIGLAIMITIGVYYIAERGISALGRSAMLVTITAGLLFLLGMNFLSPIGTVGENALWAVSIPMIAGIILTVVGICGISILASTIGESKAFYFSLISAPFAIIIYGLLRAEDLLSLDIITRTIDLLDIGVMIGLGTFVAYALKKRGGAHSLLLTSAICVLILLTLPFAIDSERYAGTRNNIYAYEVDAINWTIGNSMGEEIDSDSHFSQVGNFFDGDIDQTLVKRFIGSLSFHSGVMMVGSERWTSIGVKDMPYGWIKVDPQSFESELERSNVLYIGGPSGSQIVVFTS